MASPEFRVVLVAAGDKAQADMLARGLVDGRLAACVNILPGVRSHYRWKGELRVDDELILIVKTTRAKLEAVAKFVKDHHSYEIPETLALQVVGGNSAYLDWLAESVQ